MNIDDNFHVPVMINELLNNLNIREDGIYVDCTFGDGGHSKAIINSLTSGTLISIDASDFYNKEFSVEKKNWYFFNENFINIKQILNRSGIQKVDGIVVDLGLSSRQIFNSRKGFSYRENNSFLDMRIDTQLSLTAFDILNYYSEKKLSDIFYHFGEERNSKKIARNIVNYIKNNKKVKTVDDLVYIIIKSVGKSKGKHPARKVFQALRIAVNNELENIIILLRESSFLLKPGGRLVILSYHSLEDRIIKHIIKSGELSKDFFFLYKKPLVPSKEEISLNNRSRSAKMRIIIKN